MARQARPGSVRHAAQVSWESVFEAEYSELVRFCALLTGSRDVAEDLAQDCFVRIAPHLEKLEEAKAKYYLRRTAVNTWRSRVRRLSLERRKARTHALPVSDPHEAIDNSDLITRALVTLPARQRACLILKYYDDMSDSQAAFALGVSVGTIKSQCSRGLGRLRKEIENGARRTA